MYSQLVQRLQGEFLVSRALRLYASNSPLTVLQRSAIRQLHNSLEQPRRDIFTMPTHSILLRFSNCLVDSLLDPEAFGFVLQGYRTRNQGTRLEVELMRCV